MLPGFAEARLTEAQVRFCQLVAIGFDDSGKKLNQTDCAVRAGIGDTKSSSKALASRYMQDARFKAMIWQIRNESLGDLRLHNNEIVMGLRELADISLGRKSVKKTVIDNVVSEDDGGKSENRSEARTFAVYDPDLGQAHQALKTMGTITGLISSDKRGAAGSGSSGSADGPAARELNGVERAARVVELLKRSGAMGAGSDPDSTDGDLGSTAGSAD